ncbi:conserved Plasmodium protein, unknown function [Plasmodium knowlesi strain H]|uniref:Uncharacterized protein n=3 Tax=Plasmodium knowlesi TaxID=5850 RepID=A0A5K1UIJ0_PLAKH|nr:conserved Plasmodium protein, unknown function [Plasmodium knowlesi strain H]OTN65203.1 Uncharacterized protein PKNOH_S120151100 [Plasmodium knowlesi]CAA9988368.1 conserved Plasmodium protein, unknown function [Plasmodium knowlesi strain H]SBO20026.1 conserved Plasmodium protein, unknown function [Plasmodium knowlesi strain H]SBO20329.1 conserved Plasmodium protein, unknown function [Plasmodium knowlesi strain H]VVS77842.1 conserved Plasmodium protein, unknown function [Plasmodium knowlesi |eukprot:XP_002259349.1 hypothetical protein, conserved in Plasmodium species [Plasmodium knowlesi strain H]
MDKFKKCKRKNLGSLKKTKSFIKKKKDRSHVSSKGNSATKDLITNVIIKYVNQRKYEKQKNGENLENEHYRELFADENASEILKERLFGKKEIGEIDILKNCLLFNEKNELLQKISYTILYDVIKKCIDHEHVLMKVEELGFTAENIRDKNDEHVNISAKYKAEVFFLYIYKNLKAIKITKNFQLLCKFMSVMKFVTNIMPYMYKVKFLFSLCSIFNIYQKECENNKVQPTVLGINKRGGHKQGDNGATQNDTLFVNSDEEDEFFHLFFELLNELINLNENYNTYDDYYQMFNFFILRWILVYFQNKHPFFAKGKMVHSLSKVKYVMLLFTLLKKLHESANDMADRERKLREGGGNALSGAHMGMNNQGAEVEYITYNQMEEENTNALLFPNDQPTFFKHGASHPSEATLLDMLHQNENLKNEKIKNKKDEIKTMLESFYDKVDLRMERGFKEVKDTMNTLTQSVFMTAYSLICSMHIVHRHIALLHFSFNFLKMKVFEYSYFIIFNAFQLLNKLLTVQNFAIHPMIFLATQEVFTFYENVVINLYKGKSDSQEEFYQFCEKFNSKHSGVYSAILKRIWSLYMLIISDEYVTKEKGGGTPSEENTHFILNKIEEQSYTPQDSNKLTTVLRITDLDFPPEYKIIILKSADETYKNCLTNCLSKIFRILSFSTFFEEYFFFSSRELLSKDVFILNRVLKDTNKTYYGGNFKFLINFFYPLLMHFIDLYEKEEEYSIKKKCFLSYIKNILVHFSRALNDCINLYYFLSTNLEDLYILVTKFTNCNDFYLLPLFVNFFENFYLSTLKANGQGAQWSPQSADNDKERKDIKCKYSLLNLEKNNFFLNNISDNLLKIFLPRFISIVTSHYEQKFANVGLQSSDNRASVSMVIESFSNLLHVSLHFSSDANLSEVLNLLEQLILRNEIEKEIYSLISIIIVLKILTPFFTYEELTLCSLYYQKLLDMVGQLISRKISTTGAIIGLKGKRADGGRRLQGEKRTGGDNHQLGSAEHSCYVNPINVNTNVQFELPTQVNGEMCEIGMSSQNDLAALRNNGNYGNLMENNCVSAPGEDAPHEKANHCEETYISACNKPRRNSKKSKQRGNKDQNGIGKKGKIKGLIKKEKRKDNSAQKEKARRTKITKELKMDIEKYKFVRILIYDNVAALFKYFGNIFSKKNISSGGGVSKNMGHTASGTFETVQNGMHPMSKNEMLILSNIYMNGKVVQNKLPIMITKENILPFFDSLDHYNINKYIKKFYVYLNGLTFYLKEGKLLDRDYCHELFFEILPLIMKALFYINKKFTTKLRRNSLFEHIIQLGSSNLKTLFLHVTPGLLVEETSCKKIAIYLLYLLVRRYKIEYGDQVQLFSVCVALSNNSEKSLLKIFVKFLLTCVQHFRKEVVLGDITELMNLLNTIAQMKKGVNYLIEKFLYLLYHIVSESEQGTEHKEKPYDVIMKYLSKANRKIFNKMVQKKGLLDSGSGSDRCNDDDGVRRRGMTNNQGRDKLKSRSAHTAATSSDEGSSVMSYAMSEDDALSESSGASTYNHDEREEGAALQNKGRNKRGKKNTNQTNRRNMKGKNQNSSLSTFFDNLKSMRGQKETNYIKNAVDNILQSQNKKKKKKKKREKGKEEETNFKMNRNVSDVLNNLGTSLFKSKAKFNIPFSNEKEINDLFGEQYFVKRGLRKEKRKASGGGSQPIHPNSDYDNSDGDEDKGDDANVEVGLDGKIIIHTPNANSQNARNKKKDDAISKKYNALSEKQNMHAKMKLHNRAKNKKKTNNFVTADKKAYTSKKGKGDIIKKDKLLPYSYVELKPIMTKDKFRTKTMHAFRSIKNNSKRRAKKGKK